MNIITRSKSNKLFTNKFCRRSFWEWINIMFNKVDEERLKLFGPDRTCAEWLLRNGAAVKWVNSEKFLRNYNLLPPEGTTLYIKEVDATDSSIKHYGFLHFSGCNHIDTLILHKCYYIEDKAFEYLNYLDKSLNNLQISSCNNVTGKGLMHLSKLNNLKKITLFDLPYVKGETINDLKKKLPNCTIEFK